MCREEEKMDRLALVKIKTKKYGIRKISKEENMRLKGRTEERLEIATARGNLWKKYREGGGEMEEQEAGVWEDLRMAVLGLEEERS